MFSAGLMHKHTSLCAPNFPEGESGWGKGLGWVEGVGGCCQGTIPSSIDQL